MIIVTTPTGNVGREVVRLLNEQHLPFRSAARNPESLRRVYGADAPTARFDFAEPSTWPEAFRDSSVLFLVCPQPDPQTIRTQILPCIDAAINAGCQHIIYQSVPGADHLKIMPHYQIERYIEASGVDYTLLRPSYFMQNFIRKAPTHDIDIATHHEIFLPAGNGRLSLIDASDVAEAVVAVCQKLDCYKNQGYTLTGSGSEVLNMDEIATVFSRVLKQPITYPRPSLLQFWLRLRKRGVPLSLLLVMSVEYTVARLGKYIKSTDCLARIIGHPPTTLAAFVEANRQHWLAPSWSQVRQAEGVR